MHEQAERLQRPEFLLFLLFSIIFEKIMEKKIDAPKHDSKKLLGLSGGS
jgi:hypothetical protein